ncbi:MAG: ABC transporter ATP-binding protein [Patescibacteria group bacterium]
MNPLIITENLSKTYGLDGLGVPALSGVNVAINPGELVAIMGPSGCGKSTLMHLLGLLDTPSSGRILFKDRDISKFSENDRAAFRSREVGFVFQQFNLLPRLSTLENVLLPTLYFHGEGDGAEKIKDSRRRALTILSEVGLGKRIEHRPNQLSGGEQQRVAIARSLINDPSLVLADEPTGNLDSRSGGEIMELLKELNRKGKTLVVVTHDNLVADRCQRTIRMKDGRVVD